MIEAIYRAQEALRGQVVRTPLVTFPDLNTFLGGRLYLKLENLQHTGSFKYRGALNHVRTLVQSSAETPVDIPVDTIRGAQDVGTVRTVRTVPTVQTVLAVSSGNHAQAVAKAAKDAGLSATLVMPSDAPRVKIARVRALGARVVTFDRQTEDREAILQALPEASKAYIIPPYDHPLTIAGQGTIGLEVAEQLEGASLDQLLICCGGGGLATGTATALQQAYPALDTTVVEPEGFDDFTRSLTTGTRQSNPRRVGSLCDALLTPTPGALTLPLAHNLGIKGVVVSDAQALAAVAYAAQKLRLIVEPGGAVALAAALFAKVDLRGKTTVAVISGGNIDCDVLTEALAIDLQVFAR